MRTQVLPAWSAVFALGVCLLSTGVRSAAQPSQPPAAYRSVGKRIQEALEKRPHFREGESLTVYRLKPVDARQVRVRAVALANQLLDKLGGGGPFSEQALRAEDDYFIARNDRDIKLQAYAKSGFISVTDQKRVFKGRCDDLPDDRAADLARKFVEESRLVQLLPNERLTVARVKRVRTQSVLAESGQMGEAILNNVVVVMGRELDGKPVFGPGGQVVVFLGGPGEVVGVQRNWREIEPTSVDRVRGKGPAAAANRAASELGRRYGPNVPAAQAFRISQSEFGYFAHGKHQSQRFLQPAYAVHVEVRNERASHSADVIVVSGADRELEPLAGPPRKPAGKARPATLPPAEEPDR